MAITTDRDPILYTQSRHRALQDLKDQLREDIEKVDEPQFKAMFETAAEVLEGLQTAFRHYELKSEPAWRP